MKKIVGLGLALAMAFGLSACGGSETGSSSSASSSAKTEESTSKAAESTEESTMASSDKSEESKATYKDRTLTAPDGVLKITGFERSVDFEGKPMFYVFFDLTNNTDEPQNVQMQYMSFVSVSQNTGATTEDLDMAIMSEDPHQDKADMLNKDINPGATISAAYTYNFADENKPVTFTFTDTMFSFDGPIATEDIEIPK